VNEEREWNDRERERQGIEEKGRGTEDRKVAEHQRR
jgi:hypothetical protein